MTWEQTMKCPSIALSFAAISLLCGCSTVPEKHYFEAETGFTASRISTTDQPHDTILLVSLDNGQVIMQKIASGADICFKHASRSSTTCLTQGAPLLDPYSNEIIGFEMIEDHIDLIGKTD